MEINQRGYAEICNQMEVAAPSQKNKYLRFKVLPWIHYPKKVGLGAIKAFGFQHEKTFLLLEGAKVFGEAYPALSDIVPTVACQQNYPSPL